MRIFAMLAAVIAALALAGVLPVSASVPEDRSCLSGRLAIDPAGWRPASPGEVSTFATCMSDRLALQAGEGRYASATAVNRIDCPRPDWPRTPEALVREIADIGLGDPMPRGSRRVARGQVGLEGGDPYERSWRESIIDGQCYRVWVFSSGERVQQIKVISWGRAIRQGLAFEEADYELMPTVRNFGLSVPYAPKGKVMATFGSTVMEYTWEVGYTWKSHGLMQTPLEVLLLTPKPSDHQRE